MVHFTQASHAIFVRTIASTETCQSFGQSPKGQCWCSTNTLDFLQMMSAYRIEVNSYLRGRCQIEELPIESTQDEKRSFANQSHNKFFSLTIFAQRPFEPFPIPRIYSNWHAGCLLTFENQMHTFDSETFYKYPSVIGENGACAFCRIETFAICFANCND